MSDGIELTDDEYDTFMAVLAEQRCQHSHADTACPPPPERAILTDLITELREAHHSEPYALTDGHYCPTCQTRASRMSDKPVDWPCDTASMADRAEARLRKVTGHE